jgi:hypothetical protein
LFCVAAHAEVLVEPSLGLGYGSSSASISNLNYNQSATAPSGGLKLGYFTDYVFLGLDTQISYLIMSGQSQPLYTAGFGLGFTADYVPLRYYAAIDLINVTQYQGSSLSSFGFRAGIGYYVNEDMMVNLEYQIVSFSNQNASYSNTDNFRAFFVMLSFPMMFDYPSTPWRERYRSRQGPSASGGDSSSSSGGSGKDLDLE